jgi:hypothetical protein
MLYYCIAPIRYLDMVVDEPRHLVIAQHLKNNPKVLEFFIRQRERGHEIILDNGAYEFGEPMKMSDYFSLIEDLKPQIVVSPDSWKNTNVTIDLVKEFSDRKAAAGYSESEEDHGEYTFTSMYVPQGQNLHEYIRCCMVTSVDSGTDSIMGVSVGSWKDATGVIRPFIVKNLGGEHMFHLLGLWNMGELIKHKVNGAFPRSIRSIDTSWPFKMAVDPTNPTAKMDFEMNMNVEQENAAKVNLKELRRFIENEHL